MSSFRMRYYPYHLLITFVVSSLRKQLKGQVDMAKTFEIGPGIYSKPTTVNVEILRNLKISF